MRQRWSRPGLLEHLSLILALVAVAVVCAQQGWLWRWNNLIYDAQMRLWSRPAVANIVLVTVDEASLEQLGRWPWNRRLHAQLIERLSAEGARVIALDIIFAEADRHDPGADVELARAIAANGRTVLPVIVEQPRHGAQLIETLPLPALAASAAALGHVHFELDPDTIARRTYLHEGLGDARWPALSLAMLQIGDPARAALHGTGSAVGGRGQWVRQQELLVPFAGPPGHFTRISYLQVLNGEYPRDSFRDKYVLVGTTATGLGDILPTPVSGHEQPMPGVELNANVLDALLNSLVVRSLPLHWYLLLNGLIAALPMLLYLRLAPRAALLATTGLFGATLAASSVALFSAHYWFAPAPALLTLVVSYPLWSWRRLEHTMRFLRQELDRLHAEQERLPNLQVPELASALEFMARFLPISGWHVADQSGRRIDGRGGAPAAPGGVRYTPSQWAHHNDYWWSRVWSQRQPLQVCLQWQSPQPPGAAQRRCLDELLRVFSPPLDTRPQGTVALVEARIREVQTATQRLQGTRRILDNSLATMADGTLALSVLGQVMFANPRADTLLHGQQNQTVVGTSFTLWLARGGIQDPQIWYDAVQSALVKGEITRFEMRNRQDRDLLVQFAPLGSAANPPLGVVINLSDISALKDSERRRAEALGFLSHDLRSPLVSLLAVLELARRGEPNEDGRRLIDRAKLHTEKTLTLAEQFLELARVESSDDIQYNGVDIIAVADNAFDEVWSEAQRKQIQLERRYTLEEAWIEGDAGLLERALINLLSNAVKYSPAHTRVELSLELRDQALLLGVADEGIGIPEHEREKLFDRFTRGEDGRRSGERGSGLGLAFVKAVAERHGGEVVFEPGDGSGSHFYLRLPLATP